MKRFFSYTLVFVLCAFLLSPVFSYAANCGSDDCCCNDCNGCCSAVMSDCSDGSCDLPIGDDCGDGGCPLPIETDNDDSNDPDDDKDCPGGVCPLPF
ncbi:MAG: hypothetical protein WC002_09830 [Candidatus Muiribacteriota bacterium]